MPVSMKGTQRVSVRQTVPSSIARIALVVAIFLSVDGTAVALHSGPAPASHPTQPALSAGSTSAAATNSTESETPFVLSGATAASRISTKTTSYQESSSRVTYSGTWASAKASGYSGGAVRYSRQKNASATFRFTGVGVSWVGPVGPTRGSAKVYVDGVYKKTVSLYRSVFIPRKTLYSASWSSSRSHTLKIVVVGTSGHPMVAIDTLRVGAVSSARTASTASPRPVATTSRAAPAASAPGSVRRVTSSISVSAFEALAANTSVGVIEMAGGVYHGWRAQISRTTPLVIRAAPGATVTFDAANDGSYGDPAFYFSGAAHITLDGCPGRFAFSHYLLAQTGLFLVIGSSFITADCITVRYAAANSLSGSQNSHVIYVSRGSHDLVFDDFNVAHVQASDVAGASYGLSGLHVYTGGSGASVYNVTARNWTIADANWALVIRNHTTGVKISGWRVSDSGHATGVAMDFGSDNTGTVSNSVTTSSVGRGVILGQITDTGGNSWR